MELISLEKAVHLGEGKFQFQTSAALWQHPAMEKASGVNLKEKPGVGPLRQLDCWFQLPSDSSCS